MHTHGTQNSKYIGITTDGVDALKFAHQKLNHIKNKEYKAELKGSEWCDIEHDDGARDETQNGGIKFFSSEVVNHKQKMVLDEKTLFLLKISNLKQNGQKLELTKKVDEWLKCDIHSPFAVKPCKKRNKSVMNLSFKDSFAREK